MKVNVVVLCQLKNFKKQAAKEMADCLDMFYADTDDIMNFENINMEEILKNQGPAYYAKIEKETILDIASFEYTIITTATNSIFERGIADEVKKTCFFVYLQVPFKIYKAEKGNDVTELNKKTLILDEMVFSETDKIYIQKCDAVVPIKKLHIKKAAKKLIKTVKKLFKGEQKK